MSDDARGKREFQTQSDAKRQLTVLTGDNTGKSQQITVMSFIGNKVKLDVTGSVFPAGFHNYPAYKVHLNGLDATQNHIEWSGGLRIVVTVNGRTEQCLKCWLVAWFAREPSSEFFFPHIESSSKHITLNP